MKSEATSIDEYLERLPENRREAMTRLRKIIKTNLPKGFVETMSYGMIGYVVPHETYPAGYHCDPRLPLPFLNIASQKNHVAIYHMGIYATPQLLSWFTEAHAKASSKKLDMGKSCIRYKNAEDIPYELIAELVSKITPQEWIDTYESVFRKKDDGLASCPVKVD